MLVSINWIREFVKIPNISPKEIYTKFTLATAEVEDVIKKGEHLDKIIAVKIIAIEKHPEADNLNLVTFKLSNTETKKVVCGAGNVEIGKIVPYASIGVELPSGLILTPKKIRGVLSEGMLCSEEELGFAENSTGLLILPEDTEIGISMGKLFKKESEIVFDIDNKSLTHRPDLWGHYGMAREFATIFELPLLNFYNSDWEKSLKSKLTNENSPVKVNSINESALKNINGIFIKNITVKDSANWIKERLISCGIKPINNLVDISNYVMLELGHPLHIYDKCKIVGSELQIKSLENEDVFVTLDGEKRELKTGDTVICDKEKILVLAGIMGGKNCAVDENTKEIFIEVANWVPSKIRKTSTRLGLRTEASQRFEKSLDSNLIERVLLRTIDLILKDCKEAIVCGSIVKNNNEINQNIELKIETSVSKISKIIGKEIPFIKIKKIFESLEFQVNNSQDNLIVTVPSFRSTKDISCEMDLIEEIGRHIGYDNIEPESPLDLIKPVKMNNFLKMQRSIKDFLSIHTNAFEVMTYPLIGEKLLKKAQWNLNTNLKLINSLSVDHNLMRPSLIPNLLELAEINGKNFERFRVFEIGRSYLDNLENFSMEEMQLAIAFFDKDENVFTQLSNSVSNLLDFLNINYEITNGLDQKFSNPMFSKDWIGLHPYELQNIKIMGKNQGAIISVNPILLREFKLKGHLTIAVINLSTFEKLNIKDKIKYLPISKFPVSTFDWTVATSKETLVLDIVQIILKKKISELKSVEVVTIFENEDKKFVTLKAIFSSETMTLTSEMIKKLEIELIKLTSDAGYPLK